MTKWYYNVLAAHTHVRVFMNGALCGVLTFRNEEFVKVKAALEKCMVHVDYDPTQVIEFIEEHD
jgi:hypothetical protein